jgi:cholesterol oxidase
MSQEDQEEGNGTLDTMHSRRAVLARVGAVALGAAVAPTSLLAPASTLRRAAAESEPVDALIVGSGYAGSVAALRLAQNGINSLVLERGRRWPITPAGDTFGGPPVPDGRTTWLSPAAFTGQPVDVYVGVLEAVRTNGLMALCGAGVGGGSLVNTTVMLQPNPDLFNRALGAALNYAEMTDRWYPRARALIEPETMPDDILNSSYYTAARSFADHAARAGLPATRVPLAMNWQTVREEMAGAKAPSAIIGRSIWGMNSGAKKSVDRTILAAAEATGRVTVQTLTRVVDITPVAGRYLVSCERIDERGNVLARPQFSAPHVFLAAGSINTTRLLVRAKARGSLPALNAAVGALWGTNGDHQTARVGLPFNNPSQGGPSGLLVEDLANPYGPVSLLNFPWPLPVPDGGGAIAGLASVVSPPLGWFGYDAATDTVQLNWPAADPRLARGTQAVTALMDRLNAANGTTTLRLTPASTSHPLGGAVLGLATRGDGSLYGYQNLYVIDSALLPGTMATAPPALTVTALADRCVSQAMERIIARIQSPLARKAALVP